MADVIIKNQALVHVSLSRPYCAGQYQNGKVEVGLSLPLEAGKDPGPVADKIFKRLAPKVTEFIKAEIAACKEQGR
jgi:hypothetical protein